jgi:MFS family permease
LIASQLGLTASFTLSSVVSFSALLLVFFAVRPDRSKSSERSTNRGGLRAAFARAEHRWLMVIFLAGDAGIQGLRPLIPVIISQRVADPATVVTMTGVTATLAMSGTVVAALAVGRLSAHVTPSTILRVTLPIAALAAAIVPFAQGTLVLLAAWAFLGLASGATTPAVFAWLGRLSPGSSGAFALLATINMLDFAIGPAVMGQASIYGLDWPFRIAAATTAAAFLFVMFSRPREALAVR